MTDSVQVPWGKGEKNPDEGSEIDLKPAAYKRSEAYAHFMGMADGVPFAWWASELRDMARLKDYRSAAEAKASVKSARNIVIWRRHETEWSIHDQVEARVIPCGGPN